MKTRLHTLKKICWCGKDHNDQHPDIPGTQGRWFDKKWGFWRLPEGPGCEAYFPKPGQNGI